MKTKELIRLLQEADPSGEIECCVGGDDIYTLEVLPGYYDGYYTVLTRDDALKPYYDIVGAEIKKSGTKLRIGTMGWRDIIWDDINMPVTLDKEAARYGKLQEEIDKVRSEASDCEKELTEMGLKEVRARYRNGFKAAQAKGSDTSLMNVQWWWKADNSRTTRPNWDEKDADVLNNGCSKAIVCSGEFKPVDNGSIIVWEYE